MPRTLGGERRVALRAQPQQIAEGGQELDRGLGGQRLQAAEVDLLLHQAVGGEGEGEDQGDPRRLPVSDGQDEDGGESDADRRPLHGPQPFFQEQHAHRDGDQRVDEVSEGGLDDPVVVHGPDVDAPVDGDDGRGDRDECEPPRLPQQLSGPLPASYDEKHRGDDDEGPRHPMGEDLGRIGRLEQGEVEGKQPPHPVGREAVQQSYAPLTLRLPGHRLLLHAWLARTKVAPNAPACHARIAIRS